MCLCSSPYSLNRYGGAMDHIHNFIVLNISVLQWNDLIVLHAIQQSLANNFYFRFSSMKAATFWRQILTECSGLSLVHNNNTGEHCRQNLSEFFVEVWRPCHCRRVCVLVVHVSVLTQTTTHYYTITRTSFTDIWQLVHYVLSNERKMNSICWPYAPRSGL